MNIFFASDTHFGHQAIMRFCPKRLDRWPTALIKERAVGDGTTVPVFNVDVMNEGLISHWNSVVGYDDVVYHLGDVSFAPAERTVSILRRLNGVKRLIIGNHDKQCTSSMVKDQFESIEPYGELKYSTDKYGSGTIIMMHYPIESWNGMHRNTIHVHGHTHGNISQRGRRFDVGIDSDQITGQCEHRPYSLDEVLRRASSSPSYTVDHHRGEK